MIHLLEGIVFWYWLIIALILAIFEVLGMTGFFIGVAAAALLVGIGLCVFPGMPCQAQFMVFGALSVVFTGMFWKYFRRFNEKSDAPNLNNRAAQFIGKTLTATEAIVNGNGRIMVDDTFWTVRSDNDIAEGAVVEVTGIDGMTLLVSEKE